MNFSTSIPASTNSFVPQNTDTLSSNCDYRLIKSSKRSDKLSYEGFIYIFHHEDSVKAHWRCQVKDCKGRLHTKTTNVFGALGQDCHGPVVGAEEVFKFCAGIKRRARESHDNPYRIIDEAFGDLSELAKTLLSKGDSKRIDFILALCLLKKLERVGFGTS